MWKVICLSITIAENWSESVGSYGRREEECRWEREEGIEKYEYPVERVTASM